MEEITADAPFRAVPFARAPWSAAGRDTSRFVLMRNPPPDYPVSVVGWRAP